MDLRERASATGAQAHRHPWEQSRLEFFARTIRSYALRDGAAKPLRVLDVGAGDAWFAGQLTAQLPAGSTVDCWDIHYDGPLLAELEASAPPGVRFHAQRPATRYDLILLLDVIEHVEDDLGLLRELVEHNLADGARVLLSVPAWQALFSEHDRALLHHRRYAPWRLRAVTREAGLAALRSGGLFHSLLVPRALQKARETVARVRRRGESPAAPPDLGQWQAGALTTAAVLGALRTDNMLSHACARLRVPLPGLSWWMLCESR